MRFRALMVLITCVTVLVVGCDSGENEGSSAVASKRDRSSVAPDVRRCLQRAGATVATREHEIRSLLRSPQTAPAIAWGDVANVKMYQPPGGRGQDASWRMFVAQARGANASPEEILRSKGEDGFVAYLARSKSVQRTAALKCLRHLEG